MLGLGRPSGRGASAFASFAALLSFAVLGVAQTTDRPAERVRVTYEAAEGCPTSESFLAEVRARVGSSWEAAPNEMARTIEVRVTSSADRSVARIDFVDENNQPITRVVTAKTCSEVVTGIALVTALAIESRIAEAVGKSDPAPSASAPSSLPSSAPVAPAAEPAPPDPNAARSIPAPREMEKLPYRPPSPPPHLDLGGGILVAAGTLPRVAFGPRGFIGLGWDHGPDFRLGVDFTSAASVETPAPSSTSGTTGDYLSSFRLLVGRASACPFVFGRGVRLLPCGGVEIGVLRAEGLGSKAGGSLEVTALQERNPVWVAPFLSVRGDVVWDVVFAEIEASLAFPVTAGGKDFGFETRPGAPGSVTATVYQVWPVSPGASLAIGVRL